MSTLLALCKRSIGEGCSDFCISSVICSVNNASWISVKMLQHGRTFCVNRCSSTTAEDWTCKHACSIVLHGKDMYFLSLLWLVERHISAHKNILRYDIQIFRSFIFITFKGSVNMVNYCTGFKKQGRWFSLSSDKAPTGNISLFFPFVTVISLFFNPSCQYIQHHKLIYIWY